MSSINGFSMNSLEDHTPKIVESPDDHDISDPLEDLMTAEKLKPVNLNVPLGSPTKAQERRKVYEKIAAKQGVALGRWARLTLDKAAGFKEE